jgi:hypothetical protein
MRYSLRKEPDVDAQPLKGRLISNIFRHRYSDALIRSLSLPVGCCAVAKKFLNHRGHR